MSAPDVPGSWRSECDRTAGTTGRAARPRKTGRRPARAGSAGLFFLLLELDQGRPRWGARRGRSRGRRGRDRNSGEPDGRGGCGGLAWEGDRGGQRGDAVRHPTGETVVQWRRYRRLVVGGDAGPAQLGDFVLVEGCGDGEQGGNESQQGSRPPSLSILWRMPWHGDSFGATGRGHYPRSRGMSRESGISCSCPPNVDADCRRESGRERASGSANVG